MTKPDTSQDHPFHDPHQVPLARPWFDASEPAAAAEVVASGQLCQGVKTEQFETDLARRIGAKHAISTSSGSTALLVALQALGVGPGDEVIVPNMTFISTATSVLRLGARPVFCDIDAGDYNIDIEKIESLFTDRTRAIVPVHYAGYTVDMDPLRELATRHGLSVLEDAAEALGSRYNENRFAGTLGDAGIFSFTPTKPITTGEGGMIVTNRDDIARKCRSIRNFGDTGKFNWDDNGFNYRLNAVAAAIGLCQLKKLDQAVAMRRENAKRFDDALGKNERIICPRVRNLADTNYQLYTIRLRLDRMLISRDAVIEELAKRGVSTRLYYPALHRQGVFRSLPTQPEEQFPGTLAFEKSALSIPVFAGLSIEQQNHAISMILEVVKSNGK